MSRENANPEVDELIRSYLNDLERQVEPRRLAERIEEEAGRAAPSRRRRWWAWGLTGMAAAIVAALLLTVGGVQAGPDKLLREARQTHATGLDRCYRIQVELGPAEPRLRPLDSYESRLWTRGDRFWIESQATGRQVAWGRDDTGRVWFALSPREGIRFDPGEVGEKLELACKLRELRPEHLLDQLLADFTLRREPSEKGSYLIQARPKQDHPFLREAVLEVDADSRVLKRVVLTRTYRGSQAATVTFTLLETRPQADDRYVLEGHLESEAAIYSQAHRPWMRRALLAQFIGSQWGEN